MANFLIRVVVAFLAILIWQFLAALLMRMFGVRLPLQPFTKSRGRALELLTFSQSVWGYGVLFFGCGMFIVLTFSDYLGCKYGSAPCTDFPRRIREYAFLWPAVGLLVGALHAGENRNRRSAAASPGKHE